MACSLPLPSSLLKFPPRATYQVHVRSYVVRFINFVVVNRNLS